MLLASDFDNTLYVKDENVLKRNIESIKKYRSKGNIFVIITGRGIDFAKKDIEKNNIDYDYLICENGAMIFDSNDNLLSSTYIDKKDVLTIMDLINKNDYKYILDTGYKYIYNNEANYNELAAIFIEKKDIDNPEEFLNNIMSRTNTYSYISPLHINIVNKTINKLEALKYLTKLIGINNDIYTIGDAVNDISMIEYYSGGIISDHESELNSLPNKNYDTLSDYIEELI